MPCCGVRETSAPTASASWRARCMGCSPVARREVQIDWPATRTTRSAGDPAVGEVSHGEWIERFQSFPKLAGGKVRLKDLSEI